MSKGKKHGGVYEIKLSNNKYVYACWIEECSFGIFDYYTLKPINDIKQLLVRGFKMFQECKETAIRKKRWTLVGYIDLEKEGIKWPDLANYSPWDKEGSIERSRAMRNGNPIDVSEERLLELANKGLIYGFFDKPENLERWIIRFIENYPESYLECTKLPIKGL